MNKESGHKFIPSNTNERRSIESRITNPETQKLLELARTFPGVENELFTAEQAAYFMSWKSITNPESKPHRLLAPGRGPDMASALLATNATETIVPDRQPFNRGKFLDAVENLDEIGGDSKNQRAVLDYVKENGYVAMLHIRKFGFERLVAIFLEKIGVAADTIECKDTDMGVELSYDFSWPGEDPKRRKTIFIQGDLQDHDFVDSLMSSNVKFNSVLQKAHMDEAVVFGPFRTGGLSYPRQYSLRDALVEDGVFMTTVSPLPRKSFGGEVHEIFVAQDRRWNTKTITRVLGELGFSDVSPPLSAQKLIVDAAARVAEKGDRKDYVYYGSYFVGAKKNTPL
ncbi:MAG: hypothetical protein HQ488_02675 [Parcubacteria group bacterium]|nr:hypothetical protein [Parcubacteria group bacterium]